MNKITYNNKIQELTRIFIMNKMAVNSMTFKANRNILLKIKD